MPGAPQIKIIQNHQKSPKIRHHDLLQQPAKDLQGFAAAARPALGARPPQGLRHQRRRRDGRIGKARCSGATNGGAEGDEQRHVFASEVLFFAAKMGDGSEKMSKKKNKTEDRDYS